MRVQTSCRAHGKIIESLRRILFGIYPPKIAVWSRSGVDVIGKLSGLKAMVFLWQFARLLCDARAISVGQDRRESPGCSKADYVNPGLVKTLLSFFQL